MTTRAFDYKDDKPSKFWEITQSSTTVTVRYGKTGSTGQRQDKVFADEASASKHVEKLIKEKLGKGYVEQGVTGTAPSSVMDKEAARLPEAGAEKSKQKSAVGKSVKAANPAKDPDAKVEDLMALLDKDDATNRLLAKHPRASAELLEKLSHSSDKATRQGVAGNPNTPPDIYVKLGQQFPKEFLANPALDLLLMVNPALMEEVPEALLIRLLKQADCPASLLTWAAGHTQVKVQLAVAMNAKAPEEALAKLRASHHASVLETVSASQSSPDLAQDPEKAFEQAIKDRLNAMTSSDLWGAWRACDIGLAQWPYLPLVFRLEQANGGTPDWGAVMGQLVNTTWTPDVILKLIGYESTGRSVARHPSTPMAVREAVLAALAKDPNEWTRRIAAENPSTPLPVLEALAKDKDSFVRRSVAANPSTPVHVLEALKKDKDDWVLFAVARNASTPVDVQWALAKNRDSDVRGSVAENPATPVALLEVLAKDKNSDVRRSVAEHRSTPVTALEVLARDADSDVRRSVFQHPSMPVTVLDALAKDMNSDVRNDVAKHPSTPGVVLEELANDKNSGVRRSVAKNLSTPLAVLEALAKDTGLWVRDSVAENPSTPVAGLAVLAKDTSAMVRKSVASNKSAPVAILETLAKDKDSDVRRSVSKNLSTPVAVLETLANDTDCDVRRNVVMNPSTPVAVLRALAKDKDSGVRRSFAMSLSAPVAVLEILANDTDSDVRRNVATNPSTPVVVLRLLANNKDSGVRRCIAENPQTPPDLLEKLASDKVAEVLRGVAGNPNAPLPALLRLCESTVDGVRKELAGHAHRSAQICQMLWKDPSDDVRQAVLRNSELDQATLDELAVGIDWEKDALAILEHPNLSAKSAQNIADKLFTAAPTDSPWYRHELSNASAEVQAAVKANVVLSYPCKDPNKAVLEKRPMAPVMALCAGPFVESSRIVKVAGSTDWLVRAAVARNPGTPPNLLKKLSQDPHPLISAMVAVRYANEAKAMSKSGVTDANLGSIDLSRVVEEILRRMRADGQGWACVPLVNSKTWRDHVNIHEFLSWLKRYEFFDEVVGLLIGELEDSHREYFWKLVTQSKDGEVRMRVVKNNAVPVETLEQFVVGDSVDVLLVIASKADVSKDLQLKAEKAAIRLIMKKGRSYKSMIAENHAYLTEAMRDRLAKDRDCRYVLEKSKNSPYPEWMTQCEGLRLNDGASALETGEFECQLEVERIFMQEVRRRQVSDWLDQLRTVFQRELKIHQGSYVFTTGQITTADISNALMWLGYVPAADQVAPSKSARSTDWLTRLGAAVHPGATNAILKLLREDVDPDVAQAVRLREIAFGETSDIAIPRTA